VSITFVIATDDFDHYIFFTIKLTEACPVVKSKMKQLPGQALMILWRLW